ncbi:MAG: RES family NAD+ phosphorylase [Acidobacteriota bacterium]|nr:RES family NAD+ phosphorylase [Acidobacteriota bacterium]
MPPVTPLHLKDTNRLVPSRYPPVGILDAVADWNDLDLMFALEAWTNDRISTEVGSLHTLPRAEWVMGRPMSSVIMAAFCHPRAGGSRFNGPERGCWYAGMTIETAHAENVYHRTAELAEIGVFETRMQMRLYLADFQAAFHDIRAPLPGNEPYHDPASYTASQQLGRELLEHGSNGIVYRAVRHSGGECVACFRPKLVRNVRVSGHFEYSWRGNPVPSIRRIGSRKKRP